VRPNFILPLLVFRNRFLAPEWVLFVLTDTKVRGFCLYKFTKSECPYTAAPRLLNCVPIPWEPRLFFALAPKR